jgi:hypothetical protein
MMLTVCCSQSLSVLPVSSHSPKTLSTLVRSVRRAQKIYGLGGNWINPQLETEVPEELKSAVIQQSLLQNEIIFSSEGLTLFAIDHCFSLKFELDKLSRGSRTTSYDGVVDTLRRLVYISRGRPMTRGFIGHCYPTIDVGDQMLLRLNAEYEHRFGHRGVVGVNDEYMGWRRDGLTWSAELEEYGRELAFSLSRSSSGCSSPNDLDDKPLPPYPPYCSDTGIADIFSSKPLYN